MCSPLARSTVLAAIVAIGAAGASAVAGPPTRFSVVVSGRGPDIVLIPGLATSGEVWDATVKHLAPSHRVHVVHVAGFGGPDAGSNKAGDDVLAALAAEMEQYLAGLERPAVIGHSLGGLLALEVAARRPEVIDRLLVVDALPFFALTMVPNATIDVAKPMATTMRNQLTTQTDAQYAASAPMTAGRLAKSATARASVAKWAAASDRTVVATALYDVMMTDARPRLSQITRPTTVLYAFDPTMGRPQSAIDSLYSAAYSGLAGVTLKRIDESYHFIMLDQPEEFLREVDTFLK